MGAEFVFNCDENVGFKKDAVAGTIGIVKFPFKTAPDGRIVPT